MGLGVLGENWDVNVEWGGELVNWEGMQFCLENGKGDGRQIVVKIGIRNSKIGKLGLRVNQ